MTENEVRELIRKHAERAGSVRALAKEWGVSQGYLDKQIRGVQAVGDKVLQKLRLIRRKSYRFYPESKRGLNELATDVGTRIVQHDEWREMLDVAQREQGHGSPMLADEIAKVLGISPKDMSRLLRMETDFPKPDARLRGRPAWKRETVFVWLRTKAKHNNKK